MWVCTPKDICGTEHGVTSSHCERVHYVSHDIPERCWHMHLEGSAGEQRVVKHPDDAQESVRKPCACTRRGLPHRDFPDPKAGRKTPDEAHPTLIGADSDSISGWCFPLDDLLVGLYVVCLPVPTESGVLVWQGCCMQHHDAQHHQTIESSVHGACKDAERWSCTTEGLRLWTLGKETSESRKMIQGAPFDRGCRRRTSTP